MMTHRTRSQTLHPGGRLRGLGTLISTDVREDNVQRQLRTGLVAEGLSLYASPPAWVPSELRGGEGNPASTPPRPTATLEGAGSTLLYISLLYISLLYISLLYISLLYISLLYISLLYISLLYISLLYISLLYITLLYISLLYITLLYISLLYINLLYFI
ncbi:unnamed protein product [Arctogadus glacialis]